MQINAGEVGPQLTWHGGTLTPQSCRVVCNMRAPIKINSLQQWSVHYTRPRVPDAVFSHQLQALARRYNCYPTSL